MITLEIKKGSNILACVYDNYEGEERGWDYLKISWELEDGVLRQNPGSNIEFILDDGYTPAGFMSFVTKKFLEIS